MIPAPVPGTKLLFWRINQPGQTPMHGFTNKDTGGDRFMTMLLMAVDAGRNEMRWASAGHDAPFGYDADDSRRYRF